MSRLVRTNLPRWRDARAATLVVLTLGYLAILVCNLPGHLSYDSVIQLHDGRTGQYNTWHPPIMAWLLGLCDAVLPGPALFVALDAGLLMASLAALTLSERRVSWAAPALALALACSPLVLIYQGIVWKDVFFADAATAGFVTLSLADRAEARSRRIALTLLAFLLLGVAALIRQNGVVAPLAGALALGWTAVRDGGRKSLAHGASFAVAALIGVAILMAGVGKLLDLRRIDDPGPVAQFRALQQYDLVGGVAHDPRMDLHLLADPALENRVRAAAARFYTPQRVDTLAKAPGLDNGLSAAPEAVAAAWRDMLKHDFGAYARHRWDVFVWTLATPQLNRCLPVFVGVEGPPDLLAALGMRIERRPQDLALGRYAARFYGTPVYSHLAYGLIAVFAAIVLLWSRRPGDAAMGCMLLSALAFTASFLLISMACDYRYLYALDVSAMVALFHLALRLRLPTRA